MGRCSSACTSGRSSSPATRRWALRHSFRSARVVLRDVFPVPPRMSLMIACRSLALLAALVSIPVVGRAQAGPDSTRLREIVVTATRVPVARGATTSPVTVLTGEELRAQGITHVYGALRAVPGISIVQSGSMGAQTSLFLRGGESDYVRILVDGVSVNDPGGSIDLASLTVENVDRIEIARGPASVLYGSDAVTGVVQIFTRSGGAGTRGSLSARAGSYGTARFDGDLSGGSRAAGWTLAASRHESDGILAFNNDYESDALSARLRLVPDARGELSLTARFSDNEFHYPTDGAGRIVDLNSYRDERRVIAGLDASRFLTERVQAVLALGRNEVRGRTDDRPDGPADTLGLTTYLSRGTTTRHSADLRANVFLPRDHVVTGGVELTREKMRSAERSNFSATESRFVARRRNDGLYLQVLGAGTFSYTMGARLEDNERFGRFTTYRVGAAYRIDEGTRLRASVGTAFKAPTFLEHFTTAFTTGNAALDPERSTSWEAGIERSLAGERLVLGATWFDQRFRDLIQYTFRGPLDPNYFNVAAARASGLELEARMTAGALSATVGYTHLRTRVDGAGFDEGAGATFVHGARLLRRPAQSANAGVAFS